MKRTLIVALTLLGTLATLAQGTVMLANHGPGFRAPIYGPEFPMSGTSKQGNTAEGLPAGTQVYNGPLLSGSGWQAQLFAAPGANQCESLLMPASGIATFRTGAAAGFFDSVTATLWNVPEHAPVATVQLRVWDNSSGLYPTWDAGAVARDQHMIAFGESLLLNLNDIGGGAYPAAFLIGLQSFNVYYAIPEPSVTALLLAGAAIGFCCRRKLGNS